MIAKTYKFIGLPRQGHGTSKLVLSTLRVLPQKCDVQHSTSLVAWRKNKSAQKMLPKVLRQGAPASDGGFSAARKSDQKVIESDPKIRFGGARFARPPKTHRQTTFRILFNTFPDGRTSTIGGRSTWPEYFVHYLCTCFWPLLGPLGLWSTALHNSWHCFAPTWRVSLSAPRLSSYARL